MVLGGVANPPPAGPPKSCLGLGKKTTFFKIRNIARSRPVSSVPARYMLWDHEALETGQLSGLRPVSGGACRASEPVGGGMLERDLFPV